MRRELTYFDLERGVATLLDGQDAALVRRLQANEDAATMSSSHVQRIDLPGCVSDAGEYCRSVGRGTGHFSEGVPEYRNLSGRCISRTWIFRIGVSEIPEPAALVETSSSDVHSFDGRRSQRQRIPPSGFAPSPHQTLESKEQEAAIQQALGRLSSDHRSIVVLRDIEGFSYVEIAVVLGISVGTVKSRLARARADMKKSLIRFLSIQRV